MDNGEKPKPRMRSWIYRTIFTRSSNGKSNVFFMSAAAIYRIHNTHIIIAARYSTHCVRCVCVCVRIGHLIEALNFSVIVHKSRKYTKRTHTHTRPSIVHDDLYFQSCVWGQFRVWKEARTFHTNGWRTTTHNSPPPALLFFSPFLPFGIKKRCGQNHTPHWCIDAKLIRNAVCCVFCLPWLLSFHFYCSLFDEWQIYFVFCFFFVV